MKRPTRFSLAVFALALSGVLIALVRNLETGIPFTPGEERSLWLVEAQVEFIALGGPFTASLSLPDQPRQFEITQERAASPGYGFSVISAAGERRGEWTREEAVGPQSLYFSAQFAPHSQTLARSVDPDKPPPKAQAVYWGNVEATAAEDVLLQANKTSSNGLSLARELIKIINNTEVNQNAALLLAMEESRAELLAKLLNDAGIPSRVVLALELEDARHRQALTPMVEVWQTDEWILIDPATGANDVKENLLLWHREGRSLLDLQGGRRSRVSFSMLRQSVPAETLARISNEDSVFYQVGLHSLPIEEQGMFRMLMLLPLGAAVVVFMRVLIGLKTSGTFMPVLIAVAFLQTSLVPGLISFISIVILGLMMRGWLSRLNLLLVARIATLIVLVIFIIFALSIIGYQLGFNTGMVITFFPMIIIAWTIERMSVLWEEEGIHEVLVQGSGSMIVAVLAFFLMRLPVVEHLTFNFPEINLTLLAGILAMGQYTGYKLSELRRFRSIEDDWR